MSMAFPEGIRLQYASRVNCTKNGCETPHADDGQVFFTGDERVESVNGHAVDVLLRTVHFAPWIEVDAA